MAGPSTDDEIDAAFEFESPEGEHSYRVEVTRALPRLAAHENFGGVGLNVVLTGGPGSARN